MILILIFIFFKLFKRNNSANFCFEFLQELLMLRSAISTTQKVFHQISKVGSKNLAMPRFFNALLSVWISDETLFRVFDTLRQATT